MMTHGGHRTRIFLGIVLLGCIFARATFAAPPTDIHYWRAEVTAPPGILANEFTLTLQVLGGGPLTIADLEIIVDHDPGGGAIVGLLPPSTIAYASSTDFAAEDVVVLAFSTLEPDVAFASGEWSRNGFPVAVMAEPSVLIVELLPDLLVEALSVCPHPSDPVGAMLATYTLSTISESRRFPEGISHDVMITIDGPLTQRVIFLNLAEQCGVNNTDCVNKKPPACNGTCKETVKTISVAAGEAVAAVGNYVCTAPSGKCDCYGGKPGSSFLLKHDGPGDYVITITTDPADLIPESDDAGNNTATVTFVEGSPQPCPIGACCLPEGSCLPDQNILACEALGGQYQGDASSCATAACQAFGVCCTDCAGCVEATPAQCLTLNGSFRGIAQQCMGDNDLNGIDDACEATIPTLTEWGTVIMTLLIALAGAGIYGRSRRRVA